MTGPLRQRSNPSSATAGCWIPHTLGSRAFSQRACINRIMHPISLNSVQHKTPDIFIIPTKRPATIPAVVVCSCVTGHTRYKRAITRPFDLPWRKCLSTAQALLEAPVTESQKYEHESFELGPLVSLSVNAARKKHPGHSFFVSHESWCDDGSEFGCGTGADRRVQPSGAGGH